MSLAWRNRAFGIDNVYTQAVSAEKQEATSKVVHALYETVTRGKASTDYKLLKRLVDLVGIEPGSLVEIT